jgi:hypothetical protein
MAAHLELIFPGLSRTPYQVTSPQDDRYNCIAWAAGDCGRWWWPDPLGQRYWPPGVLLDETLTAFENAFATLGYLRCADSVLEPGFEKIAVFADAQQFPLHAARQLPDGSWTSKLGELEDLRHELSAVAGTEYGSPVLFMKRPQTGP